MKKILFKSGTTTIGGVEKIQIEYINFLIHQGYEVKVVIENDCGTDNLLEKEIETEVHYLKSYDEKLRLQELREKKKKNLWERCRYIFFTKRIRSSMGKKMNEIYNQFRPDILIDFDGGLTKQILKMKLSKNMAWIHSSVEYWKKEKGKIERFIKRLERYDKVICVCKEMQEDLIELNPKLKEKTDFLYNPMNFEKIKRLAEEPLSEEEEILSKGKFLLMVARFDCIPKDFKTLFQAFDIAKNNGYPGKLYIIGSGPDENIVKELQKKAKFKKEIILLGRKENPYPWIKRADKFILSSKYEGFPSVLLEGLILGKDVISSNCKTGPREILKYRRGKLFEVGDKKTLSRYILEKGNYSQTFDLEKFNPSKIFPKFLQLLEERGK